MKLERLYLSALSCFIGGYKYKLNFFMRTTPNINLLKRLGDLITKQFIQSVTGGSNAERRFLPLPPRMGGLGILVFSEIDNTNSRLFK